MGCVPPQRNNTGSAAASTAIKKSQSLKQLDNKSKQSSGSIENNNFKPIKDHQVHHIVQRREIRRSSSPKQPSPRFKTIKSMPENNAVPLNNAQSPRVKPEPQTMKLLAPPTSQKDMKSADLSKLVSVHSLSLNSNIKIPENTSHKTLEKRNTEPSPVVRQEQINITFNNNNFVTASSKNAGSLGMGRRWRQEILREELKNINQQNFKKIQIQNMPLTE